MRKLFIRLGLIRKQMSLDEYIISIRPKTRELSNISITVNPEDYNNDKDNGPEEAGCLVMA